jgi:hypothetical protein
VHGEVEEYWPRNQEERRQQTSSAPLGHIKHTIDEPIWFEHAMVAAPDLYIANRKVMEMLL